MNRRNSIQIITPKMPMPADALAVDAQRRHAEHLEHPDDQREQHRAADDERHEDGAARPQHLAEREIEDAARRRRQNDIRWPWRRRHCFTRYRKTACRLSSGDCTSSMLPGLAGRGQLGQPRVEAIGPRRLDDHRAGLELQAQHVVFGEEPARQRARIGAAHVTRCADACRSGRGSGGRCLRRRCGRC